MNRAQLLDDLAVLAEEAGAAIMPYFHADEVATRQKDDDRRSQVSDADVAAEAVILKGLGRLTPNIPIVAEEEVAAGRIPDVSGGRFWLVDALDGTKEFLKKIPEFTVNIGLIEDGTINTDPWITHRIKMDQVIDKFESLIHPDSGVLKAIIELDGE